MVTYDTHVMHVQYAYLIYTPMFKTLNSMFESLKTTSHTHTEIGSFPHGKLCKRPIYANYM